MNHKAAPVSAELLISNYPLFCLLSEQDIKELALLTKEIQINAGERIVSEGALIDYFYLIRSGTAEVHKDVVTVEKSQSVHIATLGKGDAIGLAESGFFSQTGIRKASVTAQSAMNLLAFDIKSFNEFLNSPSILYPALKNMGENFLLMHFLKNSRLFQNISNAEIRQLAHNANRSLIKSGELIFSEGDSADTGYFLLSGTVEIFTHYAEQKTIIKQLEAPSLFGESAFLNNGKRNACAQAKTECNVILISLQNIEKIITLDASFFDALTLSRIEQIRPKPYNDIIETSQTEQTVLLSNIKGNQILLSQQEYDIWKRIDGRTPLLNIQNEFNSLSIKDIYAFVMRMHEVGFLQVDESPIEHSASWVKQLICGIKKIWT
jgi:CRP-like cAMP-binding protein